MTPLPEYALFLDNIEVQEAHPDARAVLKFWFDPAHHDYWFAKNDDFDQKIADNFSALWRAACQGECAHWRRHCEHNALANLAGRLAEIIVIDQFSRNLCRNDGKAFAHDPMALVLTQEALPQAGYEMLPTEWQQFLIMPIMHSESAYIHAHYFHYFTSLNDEVVLDFAKQHKAIIDEFGRYPHRNEALGRQSTEAEAAFLKQPDSSF
ncbi:MULTISPECIES: DUF924 family protein [unclassified Psychrobacter]|uniref:DUF924 family protein n=1 Tax=unclassified Psychrobacter TaxID=196806 RepID=UPI0018F5BCF8|nr:MULTISPECIES: DUF924 family protein [unclassified Psychrobacter]